MTTKANAPSPLSVIAAKASPPPKFTKMGRREHGEIARLRELGKSTREIARILRRSTSTINAFLVKRGPTGPLAAMLGRAATAEMAERFLTEANASEALEYLNRQEIPGFMKREKAVINTAVITIAQADVPEQDVIDAEEVRLENIRTGTEKAPVLELPGVVEVEVPE